MAYQYDGPDGVDVVGGGVGVERSDSTCIQCLAGPRATPSLAYREATSPLQTTAYPRPSR